MFAFPPRAPRARTPGAPRVLRAYRDDLMPAVMPAMVDPSAAPAEGSVVSSVEVVQPVMKRYRAALVRQVTERAIVEFDALEGENTMALAEALLPTVPPEAWANDATTETWGYIDRIEEVAAAPADPATLSDEMVDEYGNPIPPEQMSGRGIWTSDNAPGYSKEELDVINAAIVMLENEGADPGSIDSAISQAWSGQTSADQLAADARIYLGLRSRRSRAVRAALSRRLAADVTTALDALAAEGEAIVAAMPEDAVAQLTALRDQIDTLVVDGLAAETDTAAADAATAAADALAMWFDEQIAALNGEPAATLSDEQMFDQFGNPIPAAAY